MSNLSTSCSSLLDDERANAKESARNTSGKKRPGERIENESEKKRQRIIPGSQQLNCTQQESHDNDPDYLDNSLDQETSLQLLNDVDIAEDLDISTSHYRGYTPQNDQELFQFDITKRFDRYFGRLRQYGKSYRANISVGKVKSLKLVNFMCHTFFEKEWHSNLNFVVGKNGSGKSAVLTGMLLGLGARAVITSRNKSIKDFIQDGKSSAKIEITIENCGALSLAKYHNEFTIIRNLNLGGGSHYKIKIRNATRDLPKKELDQIVSRLNIQIENPVAFLNQETARCFLRSSDPKDRFKLFHRGTSLETQYEFLLSFKSHLVASVNELRRQKLFFLDIENQISELKDELKKLEEIQKSHEKIQSLLVEFYWVSVTNEENEIEKIDASINSHVIALQDAKKKENELVSNKTEIIRIAENFENHQRKLKESLNEKEGKLAFCRKTVLVKEKSLREYFHSLNSKREHIRFLEEQLELAEAKLNEAKSKKNEILNSDMNEEGNRVRDHEIITRKMSSIQEYIAKLQSDIGSEKGNVSTIVVKLQNATDRVRDMNFKISSTLTRINEYKTSNNSKYKAFGPEMVKLVDLIKANESKFSVPPRGPIGSCISVKDQTYAGLIEFYLKHVLNKFLVSNSKDYGVLKNLIKKAYPNEKISPTIWVMKYQSEKYDVSRTESKVPGYKNMLQLLSIVNDDHFISNALIDYCKIEKKVVVPRAEIALDLVKDPQFKHFTFLTNDFYQMSGHPYINVQPLGPAKYHPIYLVDQMEEIVASIQQKLQHYQEEKQRILYERDCYKNEVEKCENAFQDKIKASQSLQKELNQLRMEQISLENRSLKLLDIASYQEEYNELAEELKSLTKEKNEEEIIYQNLEIELEELNKTKNQLRSEISELPCFNSSLYEDEENTKVKLEQLAKNIDKQRAKVDEEKQHKELLEKQKKIRHQELLEKIQTAEKYGPRFESNRTVEVVRDEIMSTKKLTEVIEKEVGQKDEIIERLHKVQKEMQQLLGSYLPTLKLVKKFKAYYLEQKKAYEASFHGAEQALSNIFLKLVNDRGYNGDLCIKRTSSGKELYYFIVPKQCGDETLIEKTKKGSFTSETRKELKQHSLSLSGGESSFATVCFILSLWKLMDSPFYMLDEFDVFMDAHNRLASQQALIEHAKLYSGKQFFLFTPLELSCMPNPNEACVLRMFPPNRDGENSVRRSGSIKSSRAGKGHSKRKAKIVLTDSTNSN